MLVHKTTNKVDSLSQEISRTDFTGSVQLSKDELQRKLEGARTTHLIQRVKSPELIVHTSGGETECCSASGQVVLNRAKVRMVEKIESLGAELQLQTLINRKLTPHAKVYLPNWKPPQEVARGIAELESLLLRGSRDREGVKVHSSATGSRGIGDVDRLAGHKVRPELLLRSSRVKESAAAYIKGKRGSASDPRIQRPMTEQPSRQRTFVRARNVISKSRLKVVAHIEVRAGPHELI